MTKESAVDVKRAARMFAMAGALLLIIAAAVLMLSPMAQAVTEPSVSVTAAPEEEKLTAGEAALGVLGIAIVLGGGALIVWLIYRFIKRTIAKTKKRVEDYKRGGEIVFGYGDGPPAGFPAMNAAPGEGPVFSRVPADMPVNAAGEEIVFGHGGPPAGQAFLDEKQIKKAKGKNTKKTVAAGVVLLSFGLICAFAGLFYDHDSKAVRKYPTVQAQVLECRAVILKDDDGDEYIDRYIVDFEYTVDGKTYTMTGKESQYRQENTITVYHHPDDPSRVYLAEYARGEGNSMWYAFAGIFGGIGLLVLGDGILEKRKMKGGDESI